MSLDVSSKIMTPALIYPRAPGVAETLRPRVTEGWVDMIAMGASVHSRLRELVFGGVTQSLLRASAVALFLAHEAAQ